MRREADLADLALTVLTPHCFATCLKSGCAFTPLHILTDFNLSMDGEKEILFGRFG